MKNQPNGGSRNGFRKIMVTFTGAILMSAGAALTALAQDVTAEPTQTQTQTQTQEMDQLRTRLEGLNQQRQRERDQVHKAIEQYGKNSPQAQEARGQLKRTRQEIRSQKRQMGQQGQLGTTQRQRDRERIHQLGTGGGMGGGQQGGGGFGGGRRGTGGGRGGRN